MSIFTNPKRQPILFTAAALCALFAMVAGFSGPTHSTANAQDDVRVEQTRAGSFSPIDGLTYESNAMRQALIQNYRTNSQFGKLIAINSQIKGSANRLIEKQGSLNGDNIESESWIAEVNELDRLIYDLEAAIESANFEARQNSNIKPEVMTQASTILGNMLGQTEALKSNGLNSKPDTMEYSEQEVKNFFEADYAPINPNEPAPAMLPESIVDNNQDQFDPFLSGPTIEPPAEVVMTPQVQQPGILFDEAPNGASVSVLESPMIDTPMIGFDDDEMPSSTRIVQPEIAAPNPEVSNEFFETQPRVTFKTGPEPIATAKSLMAARRAADLATVPHVTRSRITTSRITTSPMLVAPVPMRPIVPRIEMYNVRPVYVPYGGYGTGYRPYGGYGGYGGFGPTCPNALRGGGGGGFSISIGGFRIR